MVHHEVSYRLSRPVPLGTALMLLAKCPLVAEAFTLKISVQSEQTPQLATTEKDSTLFSLNSCLDLQATVLCWMRWNIWTSTSWWTKLMHLPKMLSLICGKLGFGLPSYNIPGRFYLFELLAFLLWKYVFTILFLLFCWRVPSCFCLKVVWGSFD